MWDLKACLICFSTDGKMFKIDSGQLRLDFYSVSGLKATETEGMPQYLCVECSAYVRKFIKFKNRCHRAHFALKEILKRNKQITIANLESFDRKLLGDMPTLSYLDIKVTHYKEMKFHWNKHNRLNTVKGDTIPIFHYSTVHLENEFEMPSKRAKLSNSVDTSTVKVENEETFNDLEIEFDLNCKAPNILEPSSTADNLMDSYFNHDDTIDSDNDNNENDSYPVKEEDKNEDADGSNLDEEYAVMIPITEQEAKAAIEVYKMFGQGKLRCKACSKTFQNENRYKLHLRIHDQHVSGKYLCTLCHFYYKTEFLLKTHVTDKHLYKYLCKKCPEVSFDRTSAKQHFIWTHLQKGQNKNAVWYDTPRPSWLSTRGGKRIKGTVSLRPVKKMKKLPEDFLVYSPVSQEEQYQLVQDRKKTRNYTDALFKCQLCFRGFREPMTYGNHMKKHDPSISGPLQCDMCKLYFRNARKMYKHMNITHLFKYSCQMCDYVCYNRGQAQSHYRWHKNVTYTCNHCDKDFKKASTRLTHIRLKHPSTFICNICGHSFVSQTGLFCHKNLAHSTEEISLAECTPVNKEDLNYCADCEVQFLSDAAYKVHLGSSSKHASTNLSIMSSRLNKKGERRLPGRPRKHGSNNIVNNGQATATHCEVCGKFLCNDVQARKHYETEHPGAEYLKRYMCDVCGHTTRQYANLIVHMRTHTNEKPYGCPHCDRRFSMPSNRDRHLVVHTGEKRYQCQHCNRRFTQSSAVKLHIQTVHLKIPYAPWDKKNRKRRKELENAGVPVSATPVTACLPPPQPKLLLDNPGEYLSAYITYNDE